MNSYFWLNKINDLRRYRGRIDVMWYEFQEGDFDKEINKLEDAN